MIENTITTNENLVQDISNELIFGHTHNGIQCAVNPTAKRACDRAWFSAKQIEEWSKMSKGALRNRLIELEECGRIQSGQDFNQIKIADNNGRGHESTRIGRDSSLCFLPQVAESRNPRKQTIGECQDV